MIEIGNAFFSGFSQILNPTTFGVMCIGLGIGFCVGILPGLGSTTTLALMLPFVFKMKPVEAFAFLMAAAAVVNTTGDITSILVGIPGESQCAATILDGHPMAKKGEAGRALGAAIMSSLVGSAFGAFFLALSIPIVRPLVFAIASPEFFMLSILGLSFVASLSGGALVKGLIAGGIGLFLATVGLDPMSGIQRFTFGQLFLWDGIGFVPIAIGFFAIPEIIDMAVQSSSIASGGISKTGGVMEGLKDTFRHWGMTIRCSAIGTFFGMIPGMGGGVSQWLAYAHAVQSSPDKDRFGKGAVEGVLGPGAANNSSLGGHLVTAIGFGIPSSVSMAILLGAFIIQGVAPGPEMLIPEIRGGHLSLTLSFVWVVVLSNTITAAICLLFVGRLAKLTQIRSSLIIAPILLLIYLGGFAEKNVFEDVLLMLLFGGLGWVMVRFDWPRPPLILGLVLGPMAERKLFLSINNYGLNWLLRPGVLFIMILTLAGVIYSILQTRRQKGRTKDEPSVLKAVSRDVKEKLRFSWPKAFSLAIVVMLACALWESRQFNFRAGLFPWAIGFPLLALAIVQLIMEFMGKESKSTNYHSAEAGSELPAKVVNRRTASMFGWIFGFLVAIWLLGFSIGGAICVFIQLKIGSRENWPMTIIMTVFTWALVYGLFGRFLQIPFPTGQLFLWLH